MIRKHGGGTSFADDSEPVIPSSSESHAIIAAFLCQHPMRDLCLASLQRFFDSQELTTAPRIVGYLEESCGTWIHSDLYDDEMMLSRDR